METFGYELVAGRLPDGTKDEIAISRYLFDSFVSAGYREYKGPECKITNYDNEVEKICSWDEVLENPNVVEGKNREWSDPEPGSLVKRDIKKPEDLVGQTLFVSEKNYTITGIIDTEFDKEPYQDIIGMQDENRTDPLESIRINRLESERAYGVVCVAFVGKGKTQQLASLYPKVIKTDDMTFAADNEFLSFSTNAVARFSDIDWNAVDMLWPGQYLDVEGNQLDSGDVRTKLEKSEMILPVVFLSNKKEEESGSVHYIVDNTVMWEEHRDEYDVMVSYKDGHAAYGGKNWEVVGCIWESEEYDAYFKLKDTVLVSDDFFELISEGRSGTYSYAIAETPKEKGKLQKVVSACYENKDDTRYSMVGAVVSELNMLDGIVESFVTIFQYIAIGLAIFAIVMFYNFISTSIVQKKKEIGIMRALGARGKDVFYIFFCESAFVASMIFILSVIFTFGMVELGNIILQRQLGIIVSILHFGGRQVLLLLILSVSVAVISSIIPICKIAAKKPIEAMRG